MLMNDEFSFRANSVDDALPGLLRLLLEQKTRPSRNGGMLEIGPVSITLTRPWQRYVTVPGRNAALPAQIAETMWVLAGRNDIKWLGHYLPRAQEFSDDGITWSGGYGPRLRGWGPLRVDQLWHVVDLLREDPHTRRAVINLYDPEQDTRAGLKDVPCNNWLSFRQGNDGRLHLNVATRSNDIIWGWSGINTFEWSVLLALVSALTGFAQGTIRYNISSMHLYQRHYNKARRIVARNENARPVQDGLGPKFTAINKGTTRRQLQQLMDTWFRLEQEIREGKSTSLEDCPDELLRTWLIALRYWHAGLRPAPSEPIWRALASSPAYRGEFHPMPMSSTDPATGEPITVRAVAGQARTANQQPTALVDAMVQLHKEKDAVYGDSWCRRGEKVSILANIARKVDRLGKAGAGDTELDTAMDLAIYLVKYRLWLADHGHTTTPQGVHHSGAAGEQYHRGHRYVEQRLRQLVTLPHYSQVESVDVVGTLVRLIKNNFEALLSAAENNLSRGPLAMVLEQWAFNYANLVWDQVQAEKREQHRKGLETKRFDGYATCDQEDAE